MGVGWALEKSGGNWEAGEERQQRPESKDG